MPSAALLALADNDAIKQIVTRYGFSKGLVQRSIAGETLEAALFAAHLLQEQGLSIAQDELGENVSAQPGTSTLHAASPSGPPISPSSCGTYSNDF